MSNILFVSNFIGGHSGGGGSQSAVDVLVALHTLEYDLTAVCHGFEPLPVTVDGYSTPAPAWVLSPRPMPALANGLSIRKWGGWLKGTLAGRNWKQQLQQQPTPNLTLTNSFSGHELFARFRPEISENAPTGLIVRASPRTFNYTRGGDQVGWAIAVMQEYDYHIFVSARGQNEWQSLGAAPRRTSFYIPNCCPEQNAADLFNRRKHEVQQDLGFLTSEFNVVCVASVQERKGQDILINFMAQLSEIEPNLKIHFVGSDTSAWAKQQMEQVNKAEIAEFVKFHGGCSNPLDYIYAADLMILPTRAEALPRVVLEAMALKTPVLASNVDGIPEMIEHGYSGMLFSHERPEGLVKGFEKMTTDADLRRTFAERAHQKYWAEFSRARQIERYRDALAVMLDQSSP